MKCFYVLNLFVEYKLGIINVSNSNDNCCVFLLVDVSGNIIIVVGEFIFYWNIVDKVS